MAMVENMRNPQNLWVQLSRIFGREGEDHRTSRKFYKAVFQATLIFGAETWVIYPRIGKTLIGLHHRLAFRLVGMGLMQDMTGRWV